MFIPESENKGSCLHVFIPKSENKGSCLYQNQEIRGHVYTKRLKKVTHVGGKPVLTRTVEATPLPRYSFLFKVEIIVRGENIPNYQ